VTDPSSPSSAPSGDADGVRTYRGRTIEELIPRIRAELGSDAIILREREGLMGGIGGFFAQKCVEIDAQAAPRVNVYADDLEDDYNEEYEGESEELERFSTEPPPGYLPVPLPDAPPPDYDAPPAPANSLPPAPPVPAPFPAPVVEGPPAAVAPAAEEPAAPPAASAQAAPFPDEASFAARLEEATFATDTIVPELEPDPEPEPEPEAASPAAPSFIAFDELDEAPAQAAEPVAPAQIEPEPDPVDEEPEPVVAEAPPEPFAEQPVTHAPPHALDPAPWLAFAAESELPEQTPETEPGPEVENSPVPAVEEAVAEEPELEPEAEEPEPEPEAEEPEPEAEEPEPEAEEPEPEPEAEEPEPEPEAEEPEPDPEPAPILEPLTPAAGAQAPPTPDYGHAARRRGGLLPTAERMLRAALDATAAANERREREHQARMTRTAPTASPFPGAATPAPAAAGPAPDAAQQEEEHARERANEHRREADLERRLVASGLTPGRAAAMVGAAISRRGPFSAGGTLTDDLRAMIASSLPTRVALPQAHGAVALVGAGGSGKTRSVAALAAAQAAAGTLVSVASLGTPGREDELGALLHGEPVNIIPAMRTRATARAVSSARERGLVIIDTAAATPRDESTIDVMADTLHSFGLDGIYLTIPATLSSAAAVRLIDSFSAFDLTGMVATHVDETDELGQIAELAMQTGIPLAYTLTGLPLQEAVTSADPDDIAAELLR
jgi:flagellar biosynthesis GTPase FlhF